MSRLIELFAPWQALYADSTLVSTTVVALHLVALLVAGGLALAADRTTLRALRRPAAARLAALEELRAVHRPVLVALTVLMVSGAALAAADFEIFATSGVLQAKLALVALLLANGVLLLRTESRIAEAASRGTDPGDALWARLGTVSRLSLGLWLVTTVVGTILTSAA